MIAFQKNIHRALVSQPQRKVDKFRQSALALAPAECYKTEHPMAKTHIVAHLRI
jgi:hypothetical protein